MRCLSLNKKFLNSLKKIIFLVGFIGCHSALAGNLNIQSGGKLKGSGTVSGGTVNLQSGGAIAPGSSPGCIAAGNLSLSSGGSLEIEIEGSTACSEYDQLDITGSVSLGSATLDIDTTNYTANAGDTFTVIDNDAADSVSGIFNGLAEGGQVDQSGYVLTISYQGGDGNDVTLTTILKQIISFNSISNQEYGDSLTLSASASSGLTVSYTSTTTSVCTVSGSFVSLISLGTCSITASQSGDSDYLAADDVTQSFSVTQASQTITFNSLADKTYGDADFAISATASSGLTVSFTSSTTAVCTVSGSTVSIVASGSCSITASQAGDTNYLAATNVAQSFSVNKASQNITFAALANKNLGDADFNLSASSSSGLTVSFASSTAAVCSVSSTSVSLLNVGTCSITASQNGDTNYSAATDVVQSFSVLDATAPVIVLQGNASITIAQGSNYSDAGATASDNVDGDISSSIVTVNPVDTNTVGSYTVTYNVSDAAGNAATQVTRTVNVTDQTNPVISLIGNSSLTIAQGSTYTDAGATASDNNDGDISSSIVTVNPVDTSTVGSYTVTYNVSDAAGNAAAQVTRTVNVADQTIPVISLIGNSSLTIAQDSIYSDAGATAIDNNDGDISSSIVTVNPVDTSTVGSYTITYNVSDAAGNAAAQVTRTVNVTDQTVPVISLTGDASVTLAQGDVYSDQGATASDNNDGDITSSIVTVNPVNTNIVGSYTITYNVTDAAGNAAVEVTRTVTVTDQTAPVVTPPAALTVAATDANGTAKTDTDITLFLASATASDVNDGVIATVNNDAPSIFPLGTTTVTFSATDAAGNIGSAQSTITVTDQTAPVISLTGDASVTVNIGDTYTDAGATASDNVDGDITVNIVESGSVDTTNLGVYTLRYNVADAAGNNAVEVTRSVSVQDAFAPVVSAPTSITVAAVDANGTPATDTDIQTFLAAASANDDVDGALTPTHDAPSIFPLGVTTVTFSATDSSGNTGQSQATVTIADQTAPVMTLNGDSAITLSVGDTYTEQGVTANDNVDGDISHQVNINGSVDTSSLGIYILTYRISDASGNAATALTRQVTVQDNDAPVVTVPANITVAAVDANGTPDSETTIANFLSGATANDLVDGDLAVTHDAPTVFPLGITTVTFSATDLSGNTGVAQATVTVTDQTAPVITLSGDAALIIAQGDNYVDAGASANDNVDGDLTAQIVMTGTVDTSQLGSYRLAFNVSDAANNGAVEVERIVTVTDQTAPVITLIGDAEITIAQGSSYIDDGANASDNVDGDLSSVITVSGSVDTHIVGSYTLTYDVVDAANNAATSVTRIINVTDQTAPEITLNGDATMLLTVGNSYVEQGAIATDNNDGDISADIVISGAIDTNTIGTYILSYDVSDAAGNSATTVIREIEIQDTDWDGDGIGDSVDPDDDNDGIDDREDAFPYDENEWEDSDGDGIGNNADTDDDNDGVSDDEDAFPFDENEWLDTDGDGIGNNQDTDDDNDGVADDEDEFPLDGTEWQDSDGDGIGDNSDDTPYPYSGDVNFELTDYVVAENGLSVEVKVIRSNGDYGELTIDYAMQDGSNPDSSATATNDYEFAAATLAFANGETEQSIWVNIVDDSTYEGDESFTLNLSNLQSVGESSIGLDSIAIVTIQEDDPVPAAGEIGFEFDSAIVDENDGTVTIKILREGGSSGEVSVAYATRDSSAHSVSDYLATSQTLIFADGELEKDITIDLVDDELYESDEVFELALSNITGGATLGTSVIKVTILDNDPVPAAGVLSFEFDSYQVNENDHSLLVTVIREGGSLGEVSVDVVSQNDSATAAEDYQIVNQTVSFADGEISQTISVSLIDDSEYEGNESFDLQLTNVAGTELANQIVAKVIINEDEPIPSAGIIQFSGVAYQADEDATDLIVTVTRTLGSVGEVSADLSVISGDATHGIDYRIANSSLTFPDGEVSQSVSIVIFDDRDYEGDEYFTLGLANLDGDASIGSVSESVVTIRENELVPEGGNVRFSGTQYTINESFDQLTITVVRVDGSYGDISVDYQINNGSAVNGEDFNVAEGSLYFADGEVQKQIQINITDDTQDESDETFNVVLHNPVNTTILDESNATVTITDNDVKVEDEEEQSTSSGGGSLSWLWLALMFLARKRTKVLQSKV
ncbi:immunoglobulin-like domain-containing protein [Aliikangiella coralliicola]|uniref:DUF5011 domain-containing protein n=1 Tax=Aliikangiella coralliicola TaxID=2592383 RepID=A0A545UF18_9GAMM|nr:immunoglobulin-like domain-containing protein [Aliikangiella coralliicola]TQV88071.1 DUF5011 domain-containing protein [Aliikangiella coralliicola]